MADNALVVQNQVYQKIDHPGNYDLIYMEWLDRPIPLAPIRKIKAHYKYFYSFPNVVGPTIHSVFLLENILINEGEDVLDLGTGTGIQAIFAAEKANKVVATDISQAAIDNTMFNLKGHNMQNRVDLRRGDLFGPIKEGESFDVIINNIDFPYDEKTQGLWKVHQRFFDEVKNYLRPNGRIYYQSGWLYNLPRIREMVEKNDLRIIRMNMVAALEHRRELMAFVIIRDPDKK